MREQRECERAKPMFVRPPLPRKSDVNPGNEALVEVGPSSHGEATAYRKAQKRWEEPDGRTIVVDDKDPSTSEDEDERQGDDALVSSNLQNPSDALRLLANASSLPYHSLASTYPAKPKDSGPIGNNVSTWSSWGPIQQGLLTVQDARALFSL